jgi:3'-phosphoadenosine 5'-phosphosulfate sulfotransferase (PAPS reductase)/FAD synthetase
MLNNLLFQTPERCHIIEGSKLKGYNYDQAFDEVKRHLEIPADVFVALGTRRCDSLVRMISIKKWGALNPKRKTFMPIFDWNSEDIFKSIESAGIELPIDYKLFGRSFDGIDYRYLKPIMRELPRDYERILKWFPLVELEIKRQEWRIEHYGKHI